MKKMALLLSAALVLALAAPAFAAVEFGGKLGTSFELNKASGKWQVEGKTGVELETSIVAEGGSPVKAVVELIPWELTSSFDDDGNPDGPFHQFPAADDMQFGIERAWIETEGAFWHGGPTVSTRFGDVEVEWDDYVGYLGEKDGITIEGMQLGPVTARALYTWPSGAETAKTLGIGARGVIDNLAIDGMMIRQGKVNNFSVGAEMDVAPGLAVSGRLALDGDQNRLYKVEATAENLVEGVKLIAGYRAADDAFQPIYTIPPKNEDGDVIDSGDRIADRNNEDNVNYDLLDGFNVGVETTQSGVHLLAEYDDAAKIAKLSADTEIEGFTLTGSTKLVNSSVAETNLGVRKMLNLAGFDVEGAYKAKIVPNSDVEHTIEAKTTTNAIRQLQGLELTGEVNIVGSDLTWETGAAYAAPNGIDFGAKYHSVDGVSATAGVTVEF